METGVQYMHRKVPYGNCIARQADSESGSGSNNSSLTNASDEDMGQGSQAHEHMSSERRQSGWGSRRMQYGEASAPPVSTVLACHRFKV